MEQQLVDAEKIVGALKVQVIGSGGEGGERERRRVVVGGGEYVEMERDGGTGTVTATVSG